MHSSLHVPQIPDNEQEHWREVASRLGFGDELDLALLRQALCHASYVRECGLGPEASNQRLEFLGDAVLDLVLAEHLFRRHPDVPEGKLTRMKATAVRSHTLPRIAKELRLGDYLLLGRGEEETGGRQKPSLLADCLEALVGAIYLSTGLETTRNFVITHFAGVLREVEVEEAIFDHKTILQELLQEVAKQTPSYETVQTLGPPHQRVFTVHVLFDGRVIGRGSGRSKQAAQQAAAEDALRSRESWLPQIAGQQDPNR